jgi:mannose-1-phosphate guanylyltransferase
LSTPSRPKQLLPLASEQPLVAETLERAHAIAGFERIRVLAPPGLIDPLARALPSLAPENFWIEPRARGTAPALAWAAWRIHQAEPEAVMVSLHADHVLRPPEALTTLLERATALARDEGLLLTVGAAPDRPEVGFGYIDPGERIEGASGLDAMRVRAFHEKPDLATADRYLADGYLWNTGIFVWRVDVFLAEIRQHAPEIAEHFDRLEQGDSAGFFDAVPEVSIDVAVLERSRHVGVVRASFEWDDIGSWEALSRIRALDDRGNVSHGETYLVDASDNVVYTDDAPIVLFGVSDLVVVRTGRVTLVAARSQASQLKALLAELPPSMRSLEE